MPLLPLLLLLTFCASSPAKSPTTTAPTPPIRLLIDTDTANEIDDLFALAGALSVPDRCDLRGIVSAQFHASPLASDRSVDESQRLNEELLALMGRTGVPHPIGSNFPVDHPDFEPNVPGIDLIVSEALAAPDDQLLDIVILGPCTNVAAAIRKEPAIVRKIRVTYLGIWHDPATNTFNRLEFNSGNDQAALRLLLGTEGLDLDIMSATTSGKLRFDREKTFAELDGLGPLGGYLKRRWLTYNRWWTKEDPEKNKWTMWDVAAVQALLYPEQFEKRAFASPEDSILPEIEFYVNLDSKKVKATYWRDLHRAISKLEN